MDILHFSYIRLAWTLAISPLLSQKKCIELIMQYCKYVLLYLDYMYTEGRWEKTETLSFLLFITNISLDKC